MSAAGEKSRHVGRTGLGRGAQELCLDIKTLDAYQPSEQRWEGGRESKSAAQTLKG